MYDIVHTPGTAEEVRGLERIAEMYAPGVKGSWLEPACGTGRYLRLLAKHGHRCVGFDRSAAAIEYARAWVTRAGLGQQCSFNLGEFGAFEVAAGSVRAAFCSINTIRHVATDAELLQHFELIADGLAPGGVYVVGLSLTAYGIEPPTEDIWTASRGRCRVTQVCSYFPPDGDGASDRDGGRTERVHSHVRVERPRGVEEITDAYGLRTYSPGQWLDVIDRSALRLVHVTDEFGTPMDVPPSGYRLYVLGRRN